jgi:hypothetical protein
MNVSITLTIPAMYQITDRAKTKPIGKPSPAKKVGTVVKNATSTAGAVKTQLSIIWKGKRNACIFWIIDGLLDGNMLL